MRRAVAYYRVSSERQAGNTSIPDQRALVRAWSARSGVVVDAEFVDDGESARVGDTLAESFDRRPGWGRLLQHLVAHPALAGGPELVLFKDYSRFSRDAGAAYAVIRILGQMGVEVQAVEQPMDWAVPEQRPMLALYLAMPEAENARRSINTRRGMIARLEAGVFIHHPPFGYQRTYENGRRTGIEPNPETAPLLVDAFRAAAIPSRPIDASRQMVRAHPSGRNAGTSRSRWIETLQSRVYLGEVHVPTSDGRPDRWIRGQHEPLVDIALWRAVQDRIHGRRRPASHKAVRPEIPLRGLVHVPSGHAHEGRLCTGSGPQSGTGKKHWYYHTLGAGAYRVPAGRVHDALETWLADRRPTREFCRLVQALVREQLDVATGAARAQRDRAARELADAETKLLRAAEAAVEGRIDAEAHALVAARYRAERDRAASELQASALAPADVATVTAALDVVADLPRVWQRASPEGRHGLVSSIAPAGVALSAEGSIELAPAPFFALAMGESSAYGAKMEKAAPSGSGLVPFGDPDET